MPEEPLCTRNFSFEDHFIAAFIRQPIFTEFTDPINDIVYRIAYRGTKVIPRKCYSGWYFLTKFLLVARLPDTQVTCFGPALIVFIEPTQVNAEK